LIISPRKPQGPIHEDIFVDEKLLNAGDHNGSTFFQHQKFLELVRGNLQLPEVSLLDGWKAVAMGLALAIILIGSDFISNLIKSKK
ncbi:hypothetical protein N9296_06630, partial [Amylibacter sp.]|nr:hypothetical protein [Amylibacter sp.]